MKENRKLLKEVLKDIKHDMTNEEVLNLLAGSKISENPTAEKYTLGQRAADTIARFAGSWAFIFSFTGVLVLWMVVNTVMAVSVYSFESGVVLRGGDSGTAHHDESEPSGGKGPSPCGK